MSQGVALKSVNDVQIRHILLETVAGRKPRLRRIARPKSDQAEIMTGLGLKLEERIDADRDVTPREFARETRSAVDGLFESPL